MCSRRKKREEEARLQAEREAQLAREQAARKARKKERTASWQQVPGVVPIARPAEHIQLTPIVQPVPLVPYSTQRQPLAMYVDDDENFYDDYED